MCTDGWRAITMPACSDAAARIALLKHGAREALAALEALAAPDGSSGSGSVSASEDALQRSYRELLERPGTMLPSHANLLCALLQLVPQCRLGTGTAYRGASGGGGGGDGGGSGAGGGKGDDGQWHMDGQSPSQPLGRTPGGRLSAAGLSYESQGLPAIDVLLQRKVTF